MQNAKCRFSTVLIVTASITLACALSGCGTKDADDATKATPPPVLKTETGKGPAAAPVQAKPMMPKS